MLQLITKTVRMHRVYLCCALLTLTNPYQQLVKNSCDVHWLTSHWVSLIKCQYIATTAV